MRQRLLTFPAGRRAKWVVRSILVPAITLDLGRRTWIPSSLSKGGESGSEGPDGPASPTPGGAA